MRNAEVNRMTGETKVQLFLDLDGAGKSDIDTGIGFLDHMLVLLSRHAGFDLMVKCNGDTYVDDHHSVEDIGISLGQAFAEAIGDKKGICRYADTTLAMDEALILTSLDISGRAFLDYRMEIPSEKVGSFDTELVEEFLMGFVRNAGVTLHVRQLAGRNSHHIIEGMFKSLARTLRKGVEIDTRFADSIPSTKGRLSETTPEVPVREEVQCGLGDDSYAKGIARGMTREMTQEVVHESAPPIQKKLSSTEELEKELLEKGLL